MNEQKNQFELRWTTFYGGYDDPSNKIALVLTSIEPKTFAHYGYYNVLCETGEIMLVSRMEHEIFSSPEEVFLNELL